MPDGTHGHGDDVPPLDDVEVMALIVRGCLTSLCERASEVTDDEAVEIMQLLVAFCGARVQLARRTA